MIRRTFFFGENACEGDPQRKDLLGGKGSSLAAMSAAGLAVPPGFTLAIPCCREYHEHGGRWPEGLEAEVRAQMARLESVTGRRFGAGSDPLLVSVRSGAAVSMPGMMDTILNCGLHPGLEAEFPDRALFWTVYAQFARQFAVTVARLGPDDAPKIAPAGPSEDTAAARRREAEAWMNFFEERAGRPFPRTPWDTLRACINAVLDSWNNERARIYRHAHGLEHLEGTAVTVQAMFHSRVSGIAFTANPARPDAEEVIIESAYGLGESVVSGDVTPDRFVLSRAGGRLAIVERHIGRKDHVMRGLDTAEAGATFDPAAPSLSDEQVLELGALALRVEAFFGGPADIEWGLARGRFVLLQSRPVRGLDVARDVEIGRREEIERLRAIVRAEGRADKVWVVHNLAETVEAPTPLTWDILRHFMSGEGGFGRMYRDLGYRPSARVRREGFLELIGGRIYCDVDRAAELFWEGLPYGYNPEAVRTDPRLLESAPTQFDAGRADEKFLLRLPGLIAAMFRARRLTRRARAEAVERFEKEALPPYLAEVREWRAADLSALSTDRLVAELDARVTRVLDEFGPESLKPGFFGGVARAELEALLVQLMGPDEGRRLAQTLTSGLEGDSTIEQNIWLHRVARGEASLEDFLERYGHRAVGEMELSMPRWHEDAGYVRTMIEAARARSSARSPEERHRENARARQEAMDRLLDTLRTHGGSAFYERVRDLATEAQRLLPYREIGKHYLLMGYALIRSVIVELGRRWKLGGDVFFLTREELARFETQADVLRERIARRKIRWQSSRKLDLPDVVDARDLDRLGLPRHVTASREITGLLGLSPGTATGTARIVFSPEKGNALGEDAILVCPSTDPSWTALFTLIRGLIVERGGVLSHGAITARDFSLPAVVCPDATRRLRDGACVRVDGDRGIVSVIEE